MKTDNTPETQASGTVPPLSASHGSAQSPAIACEEARKLMLAEKLTHLSTWCQARIRGDHDPDTTLTMLTRKVEEIRSATWRAGHHALVNWTAAREGRPASFILPNS